MNKCAVRIGIGIFVTFALTGFVRGQDKAALREPPKELEGGSLTGGHTKDGKKEPDLKKPDLKHDGPGKLEIPGKDSKPLRDKWNEAIFKETEGGLASIDEKWRSDVRHKVSSEVADFLDKKKIADTPENRKKVSDAMARINIEVAKECKKNGRGVEPEQIRGIIQSLCPLWPFC